MAKLAAVSQQIKPKDSVKAVGGGTVYSRVGKHQEIIRAPKPKS